MEIATHAMSQTSLTAIVPQTSNSKLSVVPAAPDGVYRTVAVLTTAAASGVRPESEPLEGLAQSGVGSPTASIDHIQNLAAISGVGA